jgi:threonine 3-dehydrogenase
MVDHLVMGGRIALLGIPSKAFAVDWTKIVFRMLTIKGIYGREMFETWHKMLAMLQSGLDIRKVITHRLPASRYKDGFAAMAGGACGKVVLDWTGDLPEPEAV